MAFLRPTFLLAEPEPSEALSSRKLVLETGKFNVITAHSASETVDQFDKFRTVDAVILHSHMEGFENAAAHIKQTRRDVPLILLEHGPSLELDLVDFRVSSHSPEELLDLLRNKFGDPREGE